jgi:hypothetical protein
MDEYLLGEGTHRRMWQVLGAHVMTHEGTAGVHFAVWAPHAQRVSVVGDFNLWDGRRHPMRLPLRPRPLRTRTRSPRRRARSPRGVPERASRAAATQLLSQSRAEERGPLVAGAWLR